LEKKRLVYIDVISFFAMLMVVLAHSAAALLGKRSDSLNWQVANSLVVVTEVAVPLFFMISGSTILNSEKTYSLKYLFKHRLVRILLPFIIWSVISAIINGMINNHLKNDPLENILLMYHRPVLIAYWFIYPLIALYLLSPLLKAMVSRVDDGMLTYLLTLWLIANIILPEVVRSTPHDLGMYFDAYPNGRVIVSQSIGYFILGYRVTRGKHRRINPWLNSFLMIVLMGINIAISFIAMDKQYRYLNILFVINIPIIAILIYLALRSLEPHYPRWFAWVIEKIAPLTYGIYLVHGITILTVQQFVKYANYGYIFAWSLGISLVIVLILHSIPGVRRIFT